MRISDPRTRALAKADELDRVAIHARFSGRLDLNLWPRGEMMSRMTLWFAQAATAKARTKR